MVEAERSAESITTLHRADGAVIGVRDDQLVVQTLVVSFAVIALDIFSDDLAQVPFAEEDDFAKALVTGRAIKRSAKAFRFGLRAGNRTLFTPAVFKISVKRAVKRGARS